MGGDNAPDAIVEGAVMASKDFSVDISIVGKKEKIQDVLKKLNYEDKRIEIIDAPLVIENSDSPVSALKNKKDSSLVVALNRLKNKEGDAFVSAGSTGAFLAGALFIVKRIDGVDRPALAPMIPGEKGRTMIIDIGANVDCKPMHLVNFAKMGRAYFESVLSCKNPSIGLINIGAEEEKGNQLTKETFALLNDLKGDNFNFVGNVEPRDVSKGYVNILVCDGFVGNAILKTIEGVSSSIFSLLKEEINSSFLGKMGGLLLKSTFKKFKKRFDYNEEGGALILGVNEVCVKAHGSSNSIAVKNAIKLAKLSVDSGIIDKLKNEINTINK